MSDKKSVWRQRQWNPAYSLMAANANEQVLRLPAAEQVVLALAEGGNPAGQPEGLVPAQQVVNALYDGEARSNAPA